MIPKEWIERDAWKAVAIGAMAELANLGIDPRSPAVVAYNHARNGRLDEARLAAARASSGGFRPWDYPLQGYPMQVEQDMCRPDPATRAQMAISEMASATSDLEDQVVELQRIVSAIATASDGDDPAVLRDAIRLARQYMARIEGCE